MKGTVSLIGVLFVAAIITGCAKESGPTEDKKERLAVFAESQELRDQIKQCNREIQQRDKKIEEQQKQISEQQKQIGELSQQIEDLQKSRPGLNIVK